VICVADLSVCSCTNIRVIRPNHLQLRPRRRPSLCINSLFKGVPILCPSMCSCHRFPHFIHSTCWKSSLVPSELASSYCPMCLHERFEELFPVRNNNKSHIIHQLGYLLSKFYLPEDLIVLHSLIELEAGLTEKEEQTEMEEEKTTART